jgi:hypothetical protein
MSLGSLLSFNDVRKVTLEVLKLTLERRLPKNKLIYIENR